MMTLVKLMNDGGYDAGINCDNDDACNGIGEKNILVIMMMTVMMKKKMMMVVIIRLLVTRIQLDVALLLFDWLKTSVLPV